MLPSCFYLNYHLHQVLAETKFGTFMFVEKKLYLVSFVSLFKFSDPVKNQYTQEHVQSMCNLAWFTR